MEKISVHLKTDALFVFIWIIMFNVYFLWQYWGIEMVYECKGLKECYMVYIKEFYINTITNALHGDLMAIGVVMINIFLFLFLFNLGFRVFEWDEERFCMKSWFGKRCYKWNTLEEVYVSTQFGSEWIILVTWDNMYYGPYHPRLQGVLEEKRKKYKFMMRDVRKGEDLRYLRKRRKEHGTHMMLFQP